MNPTRAARAIMVLAVLAGVLPGGCGWVEWPPPGWSQPRSVNRPPPRFAAPGPDAPVFVGAGAVIVGEGDTVYAISRRHRVSARAIIEANGLTPPYRLTVGQRLVLPRAREHVVARGDTLYGISRLYRVDMYALARENTLKPPYTIRVGQRLRVPATAAIAVSKPPPPVAATPARRAVTMTGTKPAPTRPKPTAAIPTPPPESGSGFIWPTRGKVISGFGPKAKGLHNDGINIAAPRGSAVRAAENGVVAYAGNELRGFGNLLLVKHAGGWITAYAHNNKLLVKRGDRIRKGQIIAEVGSSGNVSTPQLHFELRRGTQAVDPRKHLKGALS